MTDAERELLIKLGQVAISISYREGQLVTKKCIEELIARVKEVAYRD